jgi:hypothetical protein
VSALADSLADGQPSAERRVVNRLGLDVQQVRIKRGRDAGGQRLSGGMLPLPELPLITTVNKASPPLIPAHRSRTSAECRSSDGHRSSSCSRASALSPEGPAGAPLIRVQTAARALHAPPPLASRDRAVPERLDQELTEAPGAQQTRACDAPRTRTKAKLWLTHRRKEARDRSTPDGVSSVKPVVEREPAGAELRHLVTASACKGPDKIRI